MSETMSEIEITYQGVTLRRRAAERAADALASCGIHWTAEDLAAVTQGATERVLPAEEAVRYDYPDGSAIAVVGGGVDVVSPGCQRACWVGVGCLCDCGADEDEEVAS